MLMYLLASLLALHGANNVYQTNLKGKGSEKERLSRWERRLSSEGKNMDEDG